METFKEKYEVQRINKAKIRTEWESGELSGEFIERNTVERALKTERDAESRLKRSGQVRLVYVKRHTQKNTNPDTN